MKKCILVLLMVIVFCNGCVGLIAGAVMLDRRLCKKKGIEPPKVNSTLKKMFQKKEK